MIFSNLLILILIITEPSLIVNSDFFIKNLNYELLSEPKLILKNITSITRCLSRCLVDSSCYFANFNYEICQFYNLNAVLSKNYSNKRIIYTKRSNGIISSVNNPFGVDWGIWGPIEECDQNDYVVGFRTKLDPFQGTFYDDTALNCVELICSNGKRLKSSESQWGSWNTNFKNCSSGQKVNGFSYGMEQNQGTGDDSATNVIRLKCTDNSIIQSKEGHEYTTIISILCPYGVIVGLRTQINQNINAEDNTGLNNVEFICKLN
ncbi:unnamed protein product [Brachionus calyciflorus]|uniref:Apple domain-containing protein n=1 Tax=Brachionus calyciflorus TaxID=104777 RepID=A0A814A4M0_9BILA|nr:unnamed protein product [Brachionus calyciflorus]